MGVDRFVAERSLNHKLGNVEGVYDRHEYFAERHAALSAWAAALAKVESARVPDEVSTKPAPRRRFRAVAAA